MQHEPSQLIEPPPVPFSFDTPGWHAAGLLLIALLCLAAWLLWRRHERNRYRSEALQWLTVKDRSVYETDLLLKRIAMRHYGREKVAAMRGMEWIGFLNSCWKENAFTTEDARLLSEDIYAGHVNADADFKAKARRWVRYHRHAL
jgi:hypothetical protein